MVVRVEQVTSQKKNQQHVVVRVAQVTNRKRNQQHVVVHVEQVTNRDNDCYLDDSLTEIVLSESEFQIVPL